MSVNLPWIPESTHIHAGRSEFPTTRAVSSRVVDDGIVAAGTVTRRYTCCTSTGCRCNADPPALHGPHLAVARESIRQDHDKTGTAREAQLYQEWIGNDRGIRALLAQIRTVDAKAAELILKEDVNG
jgi:hypothetical protein